MKRTIKARRTVTAHVPESSIGYVMIRAVEEQIGSAGKVDDLILIWRVERFLGVPTGTDREWMKAAALKVLRACRLVCCGDGWWRVGGAA